MDKLAKKLLKIANEKADQEVVYIISLLVKIVAAE